MDIELILYGYIPFIIGAAIVILSYLLFVGKRRSVLNFILMFTILNLNGFALFFLKSMIDGAYPTFIPYILIGLSIPIYIIQYQKYKGGWK